MLSCIIWNICIGLFVISIQVPSAECRVGYSKKETTNPTKTMCNDTKGEEYVCSYGHCCEDGCCSYYYELWWFWLIWSLVILLSCCCFYHQRQKNIAARSTRRRSRRHKDRYEGVCNYPGPPLEKKLLGSCKLPVYKDVIRMPPTSSPPPPYSARRRSIHTIAYLQANERGETSMSIIPCNITSSMLSLASVSHYIPGIIAHNSNQFKAIPNHTSNQVDDNNNNPVSVVIEKEETRRKPDPTEASSPLLPPKPEFEGEIPRKPSYHGSSRKLGSSRQNLCEINNNNPKSSRHDDSRVDYDDGLPGYDDTASSLLRHDDAQGAPLGVGRNGDVVLNLTP